MTLPFAGVYRHQVCLGLRLMVKDELSCSRQLTMGTFLRCYRVVLIRFVD